MFKLWRMLRLFQGVVLLGRGHSDAGALYGTCYISVFVYGRDQSEKSALYCITRYEVQVADVQCNKARMAHNMIPFIQIDRDEAENDDNFERVS